MNLTEQEEIMYKIMNSFFINGIPINFKGSMVLRALLIEKGYQEATRNTVDIDANWMSNEIPSVDEITLSLQKVIDKENYNLKVKCFRTYGIGKSAGFNFYNQNDEIIFSMDIDINKKYINSKEYSILNYKFRGITPTQILSDKLLVLSSNKIFRRIKDLFDIYYLSHVFNYDEKEIYESLSNYNKQLGLFNEFLNNTDELKHSYDKFKLNEKVIKLPFELVYNEVKNYILPFIKK